MLSPDLSPSAVPIVLPTIGSPKQYHYRTKITPHFEAPPKKARADPPPATIKPDWLKIGFNQIGKKSVIDIEVSHLFPPHFRLSPRTPGMSHRNASTQPSPRSDTRKYHPVSLTTRLSLPDVDSKQKYMVLQKRRLSPSP